MAGLLGELFAIEDDFVVEPMKQIAALTLLMENDEADLWVAEEQGSVVAMVSVQPLISTAAGSRVGLIEDLIVRKDFRGRGIGTRLLQTVIDECDRRGYARLSLAVDTRNFPAIAFYRQYGFSLSNMGMMYRHP